MRTSWGVWAVSLAVAFAAVSLAREEGKAEAERGKVCRPVYNFTSGQTPIINFTYLPDRDWNRSEEVRRELAGWVADTSREECRQLCQDNPACGVAVFDQLKFACQLLNGTRIEGWLWGLYEDLKIYQRLEDLPAWDNWDRQNRKEQAKADELRFDYLHLNGSGSDRLTKLMPKVKPFMACARDLNPDPAQMWSPGKRFHRVPDCLCPTWFDLRCGSQYPKAVCQKTAFWSLDSLDKAVIRVVCEIPVRFTSDEDEEEEKKRRKGFVRPFFRRLRQELTVRLLVKGKMVDQVSLPANYSKQKLSDDGKEYAYPPDLREMVTFNVSELTSPGGAGNAAEWICNFIPNGNRSQEFNYTLGPEANLVVLGSKYFGFHGNGYTKVDEDLRWWTETTDFFRPRNDSRGGGEVLCNGDLCARSVLMEQGLRVHCKPLPDIFLELLQPDRERPEWLKAGNPFHCAIALLNETDESMVKQVDFKANCTEHSFVSTVSAVDVVKPGIRVACVYAASESGDSGPPSLYSFTNKSRIEHCVLTASSQPGKDYVKFRSCWDSSRRKRFFYPKAAAPAQREPLPEPMPWKLPERLLPPPEDPREHAAFYYEEADPDAELKSLWESRNRSARWVLIEAVGIVLYYLLLRWWEWYVPIYDKDYSEDDERPCARKWRIMMEVVAHLAECGAVDDDVEEAVTSNQTPSSAASPSRQSSSQMLSPYAPAVFPSPSNV